MKPLAAPTLAIVFGAFILCAETCLHFNGMVNPSQWTDFPLHDWFAGGLLIYGGWHSRENWGQGRPYQAAGWGFMSSLLVGAFVAHWEDWNLDRLSSADEWLSPQAFLVILAALTALAIGALASTLTRR